MTRAKVTPASGRHAIPESRPISNIVDFPRPYIAPAEMVECTRDYAAGWSPIDEDRAFADAALEMVGEWVFAAAGAVCAVIVVVAFLYGRGAF